jgi:hypothetical protein
MVNSKIKRKVYVDDWISFKMAVSVVTVYLKTVKKPNCVRTNRKCIR